MRFKYELCTNEEQVSVGLLLGVVSGRQTLSSVMQRKPSVPGRNVLDAHLLNAVIPLSGAVALCLSPYIAVSQQTAAAVDSRHSRLQSSSWYQCPNHHHHPIISRLCTRLCFGSPVQPQTALRTIHTEISNALRNAKSQSPKRKRVRGDTVIIVCFGGRRA